MMSAQPIFAPRSGPGGEVIPISPFDDDPWPEPDDYSPFDDAPYAAPPRRAPAATAPVPAAQPPDTAPAAPTPPVPKGGDDEQKRSKWDGMGIGGGTVRAHWETDEDDAKEAVRVVISAPPPPPPPSRSGSNGHAPAAANAQPGPSQPAGDEAEPDSPSLDFAELRRRWPALRDELWSNAMDRAVFHSCELVGVERSCLVIQMSSGNLLLLKDEKKRAIRGELIRLLGKGTDVRFIDDKTPYSPPASVAATAVAAPPVPALPTSDPVIQAGLRFFGGPLERLPDDE
jgi:hypothetical protein